ncbi:MAG: outer membrane lipoprotein-sorting protein [Deltaproteobacteria bacterium]|nr:MAG: outer membrane lipoprotein-sorting protein [Deltaproteobacteria bacterium]
MIALLALAASAAELPDVLASLDDQWRGGTSHGVMEVSVRTARIDRSMTMEVWAEGAERTRLTIVEPAKDRGVTTLLVDGESYSILPSLAKVMRLPAMMLGSRWMGSHLTQDDMLKAARFSDDYACSMAGETTVSCTPRPETGVPWDEVRAEVRAEDLAPLEIAYFESGERVRTLRFDDIRDIGGRPMAFAMEVRPADAPEEYTRVVWHSLELDVPLAPELFVPTREGGVRVGEE